MLYRSNIREYIKPCKNFIEIGRSFLQCSFSFVLSVIKRHASVHARYLRVFNSSSTKTLQICPRLNMRCFWAEQPQRGGLSQVLHVKHASRELVGNGSQIHNIHQDKDQRLGPTKACAIDGCWVICLDARLRITGRRSRFHDLDSKYLPPC